MVDRDRQTMVIVVDRNPTSGYPVSIYLELLTVWASSLALGVSTHASGAVNLWLQHFRRYVNVAHRFAGGGCQKRERSLAAHL